MPFELLPIESIVAVLSYLRAIDLAQAYATNKTLFPNSSISRAIGYQLNNIYTQSLLTSPTKFDDDVIQKESYRPEHLYITEVKAILTALTSPQPLNGKGYWISSSWLANARKYYESLTLPETISKTKKIVSKKQLKIRQRRGSDALPPWPAINVEIMCIHGCMSLSKTKSKRRILDHRSWKLLRQFYPQGPEFKCPKTVECVECTMEDEESKSVALGKKESLQVSRIDRLSPILHPLYARKSGTPSHLVTRRIAMFSECEDTEDYLGARRSRGESFADSLPDSINDGSSPPSEDNFSEYALMYHLSEMNAISSTANGSSNSNNSNSGSTIRQEDSSIPLVPGLYTILPRNWLKSWRQYVKDPTISTLEPLDCTCLLCPSHNRFVVPPHLDEYLRGFRKHLLGGLGMYPGLKVELLSLDEWDELHDTMNSTLSEFTVSFSNDGENITYNMETCLSCHPIYYDPRNNKNTTTNRSNPQPIRPV